LKCIFEVVYTTIVFMKHSLLLIMLLINCAIKVAAQPPGPPVSKIISPFPNEPKDIPITHDTNFVFNKHYYEAENHWVTFPKNPKAAFSKGMYSLAFIYFDAQAGYTMINEGLFDIDAQGHAFRDTSDSKSRMARTATDIFLRRGPTRLQISAGTNLAAIIPDKILYDMKIKKIPDWLPGYLHNNPDTFKTLAKKLFFGHTFTVPVGDVARHIGEHVIVEGRLYGGSVKPDPGRPGFNTVLLYIGGGNYPDQKFTIIIKDTKTGSNTFAIKFANASVAGLLKSEEYISAEGKVFIYDGKPAVEIKEDDLGFLEFVDSGRPTPAMQ